jgi:hypothetical protein
MQGNPSQRSAGEHKQTQRAVLALLLYEFPKSLTTEDMRSRGFGDADALAHAIHELGVVGLVRCEGGVVLPTLAARHFEALELA